MELDLSGFVRAFPPDPEVQFTADSRGLEKQFLDAFGVQTPPEVRELWRQVGWGYFADRELYVFGGQLMGETRESALRWNKHSFWPRIFPTPEQGGPIFFAETCFGLQLGFRWQHSEAIPVALDIDTFESFRLGDHLLDLFMKVLVDRNAVTDPKLLHDVKRKLGAPPPGKHYAPIVSPMTGGSRHPDNYCLESANAHFRTAIATWEALHPHENGDDS